MPTNLINPDTGQSNQQVMDSSNEVARRASEMIGGTWQDGTFDEQGRGIGGKFVSSSQAVSDRKSTEARDAAANNLVTGGQQNNQMNQGQQQMQNLQGMMVGQGQQQQSQMNQEYQMGVQAMQMTYDANLAAVDHHYRNLFQELDSQFQQNLAVAQHNAQSLNPYSQSAGAQTAANFNGKITQDYQKQAMNLQRQADLARQELAAGHYEAYVGLHRQMQDSQREFQNNMMNFMFQSTQAIEQSRQFEMQETRANVGNYVDMLSSQPVPSVDELNQMTDQQLMSLPVVQQGLRAGYDIQGIREDLMGASSMQAAAAEQAQFDRGMEMAQLDLDVADLQRKERADAARAYKIRQDATLGWENLELQRDKFENAARESVTEAEAEAEQERKGLIAEQNRAMEIRGLAEELMNDPNLEFAVGPTWLSRTGGGLSGAAEETKAKIDRLIDILNIEGLQDIRGLGMASNANWEVVRGAQSTLGNQEVSLGSYQEELRRVANATNQILSGGLEPEVSEFWEVSSPEERVEFDRIWEGVSSGQTSEFNPAQFYSQ